MKKIFIFYIVFCISIAILLSGCTSNPDINNQTQTLNDSINDTTITNNTSTNDTTTDNTPIVNDTTTDDTTTNGDTSTGETSTTDDTTTNGDTSTGDTPTNDTTTDSFTTNTSTEEETITELSIDSRDIWGERFNVSETGSYTLTFIGGASSHLPDTDANWVNYGGWWTRLVIYVNKPIEWGSGDNTELYGLVPVNYDYMLGSDDKCPTYLEAEAAGLGVNITIDLNKGDYIIILEHDHSDYYYDNDGILEIEIDYTEGS